MFLLYINLSIIKCEKWLGWKDSNLRPTVSKTGALPTELHPKKRRVNKMMDQRN